MMNMIDILLLGGYFHEKNYLSKKVDKGICLEEYLNTKYNKNTIAKVKS